MSLFASRVVRVLHTSISDVDEPALSVLLERLPATEQQRADRFRHDADRARYVVGRSLLRQLAARTFGANPDGIRLDAEPAGRPIVVDPPYPVFISLAHSGRHVAAALARRPTGIDVEELPRRAQEPGVIERVCSPEELRDLNRLPDGARDRAFMAIWARKEAYGKAIGVGLAFGMKDVTVGVAGSKIRGAPGRWKVSDLGLGADCVAALVTEVGLLPVAIDVMESERL